MLVSCINLVSTLKTLQFATAIGVTGVCPATVSINDVPPGTVLDFSQATVTRFGLYSVSGITVNNLTAIGSPYGGIYINYSQQILFNQPHVIAPGTAGINILQSDTVEISGALIEQSKGDGIDIAGSKNVNIHDGACESNTITPGLHPDCVQMWSMTGFPVQHIFVQQMAAIGKTQGFDLWDATNFGANDIEIINNSAAITYPICINVSNATKVVITGNTCATMPGASWPVRISVGLSPGAVVSNNMIGLPVAAKILK